MKYIYMTLIALMTCGVSNAENLLKGLSPEQVKDEAGNIELVKSFGRQTVVLSGKIDEKKSSGNSYVHGSIMLNEPVSLEGKSLKITVASENPPEGLYVRAYNRGESMPAWSFLSWNSILKKDKQEIFLTDGCDSLLRWEAARANGNPASQIDRLQFYLGTPRGQAEMDMTISGIEIVPAVTAKKSTDINGVVELPSKTVLVDGQKNLSQILYPDSDAGRAAADRVVAAIRELTGTTVPSRPGTAEDWNPATHTIMLGNMFSNPALRVLYSRNMTLVDEFMPGPGGYTVESVIEPFRRGADIIVLGASEDGGLALAADAFIAKLKDSVTNGRLELPILFETKYTVDVKLPKFSDDYIEKGIAESHERLKIGKHTSLGGQLSGIGARYRLVRNSLDAKLFVEVARIYQADAIEDPKKFGGPWGFDSDFESYDAIAGWDLIEHDPALSADDRLLVSNMILHWLNEAIAREALTGRGRTGPISNHLTFASQGMMMGGFYYHKYYPQVVSQSQEWLDAAHEIFRQQIQFGKVHDDCNGYQWLTWRHIMTYSLAFPDNTIVENGIGERMALGMGITMDNLGTQAPYGDDSGWASVRNELIVLNRYYALSRSNLAAMLIKIKRPQHVIKPGTFYANVSPVPVNTLNGVKIFALDKGFYEHTPMEGFVPPLEKCFDKFSFREKLDRQALYMLVDGINIGGHRHADANSVLRFTQYNREWLAENDYKLNQQKYHNSMLMLFNGEAFPLPGLMEVVDSGENDDFGYVTVRANQWGPSDWIRYYVWLKKDKAWLVVDELNANETGSYRLIQRWNGIGEQIDAKGDGYVLQQENVAMRLETTPDAELSTYDDKDVFKGWGKRPFVNPDLEWQSYPYAGDAIHVMNQTTETALEAGSRAQMIAVWHGADQQSDVAPWAVDRISGGFTINTGERLYTIAVDKPGHVNLKSEEKASVIAERKSCAAAVQAASVPELQSVWTVQDDSEKLTKILRVPDASGDYLVVGSDSGNLTLYSLDGKELNRLKFLARINDIAALDVDDDGQMELLLACRDKRLRAVERDGTELWEVEFEHYREYPDVTIVKTADIDGDGKDEIIAGCDNWRVYVFNRDGTERWHYEVVHSTRAVEIANIDGQGDPEILCGTRYMRATVLTADGKKLWGGAFGTGCRAIAAPLTGKDHLRNVVVGLNTGTIAFHDFKGRELSSFFTADEIFMMGVIDAGDGRQDVVASSYNGYVYRFTADGKRIWSVAMPDSVVVLKTLDDNSVAVGTIGGDVCIVSPDGKILKAAKLNGRIADILADGKVIRAVTQHGEIATLL